MQISKRIKAVTAKNEFLYWLACVGENSIAELARVSGFMLEEDNEHVTFFLPAKLWRSFEPFVKEGMQLSLLMASIKDFESYQLKGEYVKHQPCSSENMDFFRLKVMKIVDALSGMGIDGNKIFSYLTDKSSIAVTMKVSEAFEQTPKPGTGEKLNENEN